MSMTTRMDIYYKKRALKGQRYSITESLTAYRLNKLKKAQGMGSLMCGQKKVGYL